MLKNRDRRAVFFDRDGTLNEEVGHLVALDRFHLYPFAAHAVRRVNEAGLLAIVVTNQSGIAHGFFTEDLVAEVHGELAQQIAAAGGRLDGIYYCPHHPEAPLEFYRQQCSCRKPGPGMVEQAAQRFGIRLEKSFVVGDRYVDVQLAHRVGAQSVLVLTGFGAKEWELYRAADHPQPDQVVANVEEAVDWILLQLAAFPGELP